LFNYDFILILKISGYNLASWVLEIVGMVSTLMLMQYSFFLASIIRVGILSGLTSVVYLIGATDLWRILTNPIYLALAHFKHD
jgi:hypothetical protein